MEYTGRRLNPSEALWLDGPIGNTKKIGKESVTEIAASDDLVLDKESDQRGLLSRFDCLDGSDFSSQGVAKEVAEFYEQTSSYEMNAWAQWCGFFKPFGLLLALIFSRRLQQLNVPLSGLDTSKGMTSEVIQLKDRRSGVLKYTAWIRELIETKHVLYAGYYSTCTPTNYPSPCVKVVFPLPNGNAIVVMKPVAHPDGSFTVASSGNQFGDPGFYFTIRKPDGTKIGRYVRSLKEWITVYPGTNGEVRADHVLKYFGITFLSLHYRMDKRKVICLCSLQFCRPLFSPCPSHRNISAGICERFTVFLWGMKKATLVVGSEIR